MNIIIFGPPGAGKGTQSNYIVKKFNFFQLSTGDLLRAEIKKKSNLGNEIRSIVNAGSLVSDVVINKLIENVIADQKYKNRLIFDGYPRNITQAEGLSNLLAKYDQKISIVIKLKVSLEAIKKRITGRVICSLCGTIYNEFFNPPNKDNMCCKKENLKKRSDDDMGVAVKRYDTYEKSTKPVLNFYENMNLVKEINGEEKIETIYSKIDQYLSFIET